MATFLKSFNQLIFVMERYFVFCEVQTEFLNITEKKTLKG
jgi:hypothetical protein